MWLKFFWASVCHKLSSHWYSYCQMQSSEESIRWMGQLPHAARFPSAGISHTLVHGSWTGTADYLFPSQPNAIKLQQCKLAGAETVIAGQCDIPFLDVLDDDHLWINSEAHGMPANDATSRVWALMTQQQPEGILSANFSLSYDAKTQPKQITEANLTVEYQ